LATVARVVQRDEFQLLAENAPTSVQVGDRHLDALLLLLALIGIRAGEGSRGANQDLRARSRRAG
jgi:hypothetical protein